MHFLLLLIRMDWAYLSCSAWAIRSAAIHSGLDDWSETIVTSSSSSTTFSYSAYIPRGRFGVFYRQTSRYVKLSEVVTYDLDGFPSHAGYITMNSWAWAPELSIGDNCNNMPIPNLPESSCHIPPCGE